MIKNNSDYIGKEEGINFVIFGATGDLVQNKIIPALFDLYCNNLLPENFVINGFSRKPLSDDEYRNFIEGILLKMENNQPILKKAVKLFLNSIHYFQGDLSNPESYLQLNEFLVSQEKEDNSCLNKIFYLATPPELYEDIFVNLSKSKLIKKCGTKKALKNWSRVLVEKPFGSDLEGAIKLDKLIAKLFQENQIFRIDHYLAKEVIQNIIAFRFSNSIFKPIWNNQHVEKIEINLFEKSDVNNRIHFYDKIGTLRDVGQNHILQMLALMVMDDPHSLQPENIHRSRKNILSKLKPFSRKVNEYASRAQYNGYKNETGVEKESETDTFFELKLMINDPKWKNVPVYLRSGKALSDDLVNLKITFKPIESCVFSGKTSIAYCNEIDIQVKPEEKILVKFWSKKRGLDYSLEAQNLFFNYGEENQIFKNPYQKILFDCIAGDQTLFNTSEEIMVQWQLITKIQKAWIDVPLTIYEKGSKPDELFRLK